MGLKYWKEVELKDGQYWFRDHNVTHVIDMTEPEEKRGQRAWGSRYGSEVSW